MNRLIATVLVVGIASPAFADIRESAARQVALAGRHGAGGSLAQARPNAQEKSDGNPYFVPSVLLMGAGGLVTLVGMTHDTGVACSGIGTAGFSCGTTKSKATIFAGAGMLGVGAYLFHKGKAQQKSLPEIIAGPAVVGVRQRLSW